APPRHAPRPREGELRRLHADLRPPVRNVRARLRRRPRLPSLMSDELYRALLDPSAPLPSNWPHGVLGTFLLFLVPIGGGIPAGVLMARHWGVSIPVMTFLYFVSDMVLACVFEPMLR